MRWGLPEKILSDNGPENTQLAKLVENMNSEHQMASPHAATGNAHNERSHRTLIEALRIACANDITQWALKLPAFNYSMNTTPMACGISPWEIMHVRKPRPLHDTYSLEELEPKLSERLININQEAADKLRDQYRLILENNRAKASTFETFRRDWRVGELCILVLESEKARRGKLEYIAEGPFRLNFRVAREIL